MPNLAMRQPGTQFSADGLDLSWPIGGEREVIAVPDEELTLRIRRRIAEGQIVITDDKPTKDHGAGGREYRLLTGEDARKRMAEPAGPVTRVVYQPSVPEDERWNNPAIQEIGSNADEQRKAAEERAKLAEEQHAALVKRQVEAEKAAAEAEADAEDDDEDEDPLDLGARLRRTEEKNAEWFAERERLFMEREEARQKEEQEMLKAFDAINKRIKKGKQPVATTGETVVTAEPPDTKAQDEAFMAAEKERQKAEKELEKQRQKEAKETAKQAVPGEPYAGKTDPYVAPTTGGAKSTRSSRPTAIAKSDAAATGAKTTPKAENKSEADAKSDSKPDAKD